MKIQLKYTDGTQRTIGAVTDITTCLDADLGTGWVEQDGLIWTAKNAEDYPDDPGLHASAEILCDGVRTALDCLPPRLSIGDRVSVPEESALATVAEICEDGTVSLIFDDKEQGYYWPADAEKL